MTRFPEMGVKGMLAKFPKAERIFQVRIANRDGDVLVIDGPITTEASRAVVKILLAEESAYGPTESNSEETKT